MRDSRIELYRCLLTWGIVFLHVVGFYAAGAMRLSSAFAWCVPGFIFITGFFGCKFSWKKVLKIYGVALWCYPVTIAIRNLVLGGSWSPLTYGRDVYEAFLGNWFIHAYVGLMMLAPLIDGALARLKETKRLQDAGVVVPFLLFVFGWSFLSNFNCMHRFLPVVPSCSVLTLLGTYTVARIIRFCEIDLRIHPWQAAALFCVGIALSLLRIGSFNSVVALMIIIGVFALIRRVTISNRVEKVFLWMAPSMFSVFLLHATPWCLQSLKGWVDKLASYGVPLHLAFIVVTTAVFVAGFILDLPRRVFVRFIIGRVEMEKGRKV